MNYPSNSETITNTNDTSLGVQVFRLTKYCIILSLVTTGFGNYILGINLPTDVSTLFIYLTLLIQILTKTLRLSKLLLAIYIYIIIQTFIINPQNISSASSIKQFFGLIIFSISLFSFVSVNRDRIINIVQTYYKLVIFVSSISIIQLLIFIILRISLVPLDILSRNVTGGRSLVPEIFGIIPRAVGLSSEPASFAIMTLPGVYIALLVLIGKSSTLRIHNRTFAWIILIGIVLSFSIVGYLGLILCFFSIFTKDIGGGFARKISIVLFLVGAIYSISQTNLMLKVNTLPTMFTNISNYQYTSTDLSGFALASNVAVAHEGLKKSNYFGTGLNTHQNTYDDVIYEIFDKSQIIMELNKKDGGSLFIRLTSEFGIPGILALLIFFIHFRLGRNYQSSALKLINGMCLVILITYCIRSGGYLSVNFLLFIALYYYSFTLIRKKSSTICLLE